MRLDEIPDGMIAGETSETPVVESRNSDLGAFMAAAQIDEDAEECDFGEQVMETSSMELSCLTEARGVLPNDNRGALKKTQGQKLDKT